jgi:signal transduction histidine kinase
LIEETIGMLANHAGAAGSRIQMALADGLPALFADERAIRQIMMNLLSNAVKFTPAGGMITAFACLEADGCLALGVTDTGLGIDEADQERVFEKFGQGRHDVAIQHKGTGLGLPIAKGLVEAHGGSIALESRLGCGTTVTARFPAWRTRSALRAAS